jgi:hypothetical protein
MRKRGHPTATAAEASGDDEPVELQKKKSQKSQEKESAKLSIEEQRERARKFAEENFTPTKGKGGRPASLKTEKAATPELSKRPQSERNLETKEFTLDEQRKRAAEWAFNQYGLGPKETPKKRAAAAEDANEESVSESEQAPQTHSAVKKRNVRRKTISTIPEHEEMDVVKEEESHHETEEHDEQEQLSRRSSRRKSINSNPNPNPNEGVLLLHSESESVTGGRTTRRRQPVSVSTTPLKNQNNNNEDSEVMTMRRTRSAVKQPAPVLERDERVIRGVAPHDLRVHAGTSHELQPSQQEEQEKNINK